MFRYHRGNYLEIISSVVITLLSPSQVRFFFLINRTAVCVYTTQQGMVKYPSSLIYFWSACQTAVLCVYGHAITNVVSVVSISLGRAGGAVLTGCLSSKEMSDKDSRRLNPPSLLPLCLAVPHQHAKGQDA